MNTPLQKQKEKSKKLKKTYHQREEDTNCSVKDRENQQNKQKESHTQKLADEKDHYHGIEHHHYLTRERRRKSRSERNKRRERRRQAEQKVDSKEQSEFRKHVRKAQEITSRSIKDHASSKAETKSVAVITQNRLTRKLGLFNQGKKSSKILRDTIIIPESVQSRVEKDLKTILNQKSSSEAHSVISADERNQESYKSLPSESVDDAERSPHRSCHLPVTPSSATKPSSSKSWATTSPESQISGITNQLPETPLWVEVSKDFEESLNIEEIFPDKGDYLSTVYKDLKKMMEVYGSSQKTVSQLVTRRESKSPPKVSKSSVRRRLEFGNEEGMNKDGEATTAETSTLTEFVGRERLELVTEKGMEETEHTGLRREYHQNKKVVKIMETNKVSDKKASTEELMNAMMDGLQFLKNADEVNKIWSTSRSKANSQEFNVVDMSESYFYKSVNTAVSRCTSAPQRRKNHSDYVRERDTCKVADKGQEYLTRCSRERLHPAIGSDYHARYQRRESSGSHQQHREEINVYEDPVKSDIRMKNVTEDIFTSSSSNHPRVSSSHVTHEPVRDSFHADTHLLSPPLGRRRFPFKRLRMMESSDTDEDDDDLFPSWYMDVQPPRMSAIESPKFYPQKMF